MKRLFFIVITLIAATAQSQNVGIGTNSPNSSALLEISSSTKGLLLPRLTTSNMNLLQISAPDGMLIYNTDQQGLFIKRNTQFVRLTDTSRPFVLPYSGNVTTSSNAFQINNFGTGSAIVATNNNSSGTTGAISAINNNAVAGIGIFASGKAGGIYAESEIGPSVSGVSAGAGSGVYGYSESGTGGYFTSNTGYALVTNTGNAGIGTSSPAYQLDVNGRMRLRHKTGLTSGLWLNKADNTEGAFMGMINDTTAGFWGNATSGNWKVAIDVKNGQMGIGTTDPASPLSFANATGNKMALWSNANGTQYGIGLQSGLMQLYADASTTDIAFGYGNSSSFTERMRIKGNGNVGVGTSTPSNLFTVKASNIGFSQESPDGTTKIGFYTANGSAFLQTHTNHNLNFTTNNGVQQMVLTTGGNLGIGTAFPGAKLEVNGTVKINGGTPGNGKVLTSDATGLASWKTNSAYGFRKTAAPFSNLPNGIIVPYTGGTFDDGGNMSGGIYTVPENGVYKFDVKLPFKDQNSTSTQTYSVTLEKLSGGVFTNLEIHFFTLSAGQQVYINLSWMGPLLSGDQIYTVVEYTGITVTPVIADSQAPNSFMGYKVY